MDRSFPLTRAAGLDSLSDFLAGAGAAYAANRNTDRGPEAEATTSGLSPYLRRRLITEAEVVATADRAFGDGGAEKFVSEVFWRTYFKGHLETHPAAWADYRTLAAAGHDRLAAEPGLRRTYATAVEGRTGIDGFDDWARELVATGWLHNHARMWFASIWIFTLRLPWALGADFFLRHLLDGDPASNTLSWRWVAGLHTRGKHYVARAENIRRYTDGRFDPVGLDEYPDALDEAMPPREVPLPRADAAPRGEIALLLHLDDLHPESLPLGDAKVVRLGGLIAHADGASGRVRSADMAAMADALARAEAHFECPAGDVGTDWGGGLPVVTAWAPVGPSAAALPQGCLRVRRAWDEAAWPRATRGYSRLRSVIPSLLGA
ncbi:MULTISPECIES: FAD-binding domain-containing protein [Methylorubrum]|uniref:FAD-binding domain-containing protein n=1 Tax=Methylorubrum TaxID=2282523 RepID=UPI00209D6D89|nr:MULTISPECIES: FAD-binding domain-containing protein [Methylorubrum]MCP1551474.1 deoxyribodipyrimidine photo-lyase [Methylorubrum zatmanii]MCP1556411.1 deoxyribodipyrimidine photo-lyase [Methylorubrum extorquens]MCP1581928.1 deoxyribodipyrimidine photo-lyase [Methylorubrum extorquens]